ncbi:hypothetical protein MGG_05791 [Pyricularia oryzae 70-15]|uniref:Uncharacterized protein n=1 Tax=Pyricularia oryzae (strain 70-15 / ATCC MYA-4617 / FGSC 8958) TaxID=242507 RepID=G4N0V5_PYRO7|nr:uncharacterized protein MGG_05791 [Pyricularia oryzae 70-15]EHA52333.1 hypothetical protein MGG_05791 [Pyricularia oryzae 70-15]
MSGKVYLITGVNRGIGRGLFKFYASQPNNTVIGTVRDLKHAQALLDEPRGTDTNLIITKLDGSSKTDPYSAVRILLPPPPPRLPVARITRLAIDNNHPPVPSSPHLLGTSSPWLQTTDSSAVWTQAPLDEEPSTAVRRILRAPEGTGSRQ